MEGVGGGWGVRGDGMGGNRGFKWLKMSGGGGRGGGEEGSETKVN